MSDNILFIWRFIREIYLLEIFLFGVYQIFTTTDYFQHQHYLTDALTPAGVQLLVWELNPMTNFVKTFLKDESGATAIEYGLISALIGVVIISAVTSVGTKLSGQMSNIASKIS